MDDPEREATVRLEGQPIGRIVDFRITTTVRNRTLQHATNPAVAYGTLTLIGEINRKLLAKIRRNVKKTRKA